MGKNLNRRRRGNSLAEIVVANGLVLLVIRTLLPMEECRRGAVQADAR